jgi:hypothetical protein
MPVSTITLPSPDFTSRDFDAWIIELRARKNSAFPAWTDDTTPNYGNILLELFAHTLDVASFYQDQQFRETRVVFARLRSSMIALGKNFGFILPGATPSTADLTIAFVDGAARAQPLTIPKGTVVQTADASVSFETLADATIPAGAIQVTGVSAENAFQQLDSFVAPGTPGFQFTLSATPHVDGSDVVKIGPDVWSAVTDFYTSGPTDKVFRVDVDDQARGTLVFGDGVNGAIPSGAGTDTYKTGGGSSGNVDPNTLTVFRDGNRFPTTSGENVALSVRNPSAAGGGVDAMTVEEARVAIPAFVRTAGQRSVTHQDFEDNALKVRGVARAMLLTADDVNTIPENTGQLYIVPVGGGLPSGALKAQVLAFILGSFPPTVTFQLSMADPVLQILSFSARVYLNRNVARADARAAIENALANFFSLLNADGTPNTQIDFGFKVRTQVMPPGSIQAILPWSSFFDVIATATTPAGVKVLREVDKNSVTPGLDVVIPDVNFPVLGSVTLFDADAGVSF